jgi:hypothetical protein
MREFVTAVTAADEASEWLEFKVDGVECKATRPTPAQVAYLTAALHKRAAIETQIAGAINFCMAIMDNDTSAYLSDKLLDSADPFDLENLQEIIQWLMEEWAGRPTQPSSDSSPTEDGSGSTSTPSSQAVATSST